MGRKPVSILLLAAVQCAAWNSQEHEMLGRTAYRYACDSLAEELFGKTEFTDEWTREDTSQGSGGDRERLLEQQDAANFLAAEIRKQIAMDLAGADSLRVVIRFSRNLSGMLPPKIVPTIRIWVEPIIPGAKKSKTVLPSKAFLSEEVLDSMVVGFNSTLRISTNIDVDYISMKFLLKSRGKRLQDVLAFRNISITFPRQGTALERQEPGADPSRFIRFRLACSEDNPIRFGEAVKVSGDFTEDPERFLHDNVLAWKDYVNPYKYAALALENNAHFHPKSVEMWMDYHFRSLEEIKKARANEALANMEAFLKAFYFQAFSMHFLQDAFAAGHMGQLRYQTNPALSLSMHDKYNKLGRQVRDRLGNVWITLGDGHLEAMYADRNLTEGTLNLMKSCSQALYSFLDAYVRGDEDKNGFEAIYNRVPFEYNQSYFNTDLWHTSLIGSLFSGRKVLDRTRTNYAYLTTYTGRGSVGSSEEPYSISGDQENLSSSILGGMQKILNIMEWFSVGVVVPDNFSWRRWEFSFFFPYGALMKTMTRSELGYDTPFLERIGLEGTVETVAIDLKLYSSFKSPFELEGIWQSPAGGLRNESRGNVQRWGLGLRIPYRPLDLGIRLMASPDEILDYNPKAYLVARLNLF